MRLPGIDPAHAKPVTRFDEAGGGPGVFLGSLDAEDYRKIGGIIRAITREYVDEHYQLSGSG